jgi:hypothetical protein
MRRSVPAVSGRGRRRLPLSASLGMGLNVMTRAG